jgi:hypothetical protein
MIEIWTKHIVSETGIPETFISIEAGAEYLGRIIGYISVSLQHLSAYFNMN